jgi:hypothetical protein
MMSPPDLATLSLLDADQGVCPSGHRCDLGPSVGLRRCESGEFVGLALVCWDISADHIDAARSAGADARVAEWAHSFLTDQ